MQRLLPQQATYTALPNSPFPSPPSTTSPATMATTEGDPTQAHTWQLPEEAERELEQLEARHGQRADPQARRQLAELAEAEAEAAARVLRRIAESRRPVRNLSAYIGWMVARRDELDDPRSPFRCAACGSGRPSRQGDSVLGGMMYHHDEMAFDLTNHARFKTESLSPLCFHSHQSRHDRLNPDSPTKRRQLSGSPDRGFGSRSQYQVETDSPVGCPISSPRRMASIPSPVRSITKCVNQLGAPATTRGIASRGILCPRMRALGDLEFDKVFLIYVYLAGKKIEDVSLLHEEYIRSLHSLTMDHFESEIWHKFGHKFVAKSERRKNHDWDPRKTRVYHCCIEEIDDSIVTIFKGPYLEDTRTHLQKVVGDDNVLVVKFSDISRHTSADNNFGSFEDGIILGLRLYRFIIFKDGGKEEKRNEEMKNKEGNKKFTSSVRCYFIRTESGWERDYPYILSNKTIAEVRKLFMHIHTVPTVAKYLARLCLILSKTITWLDADDLQSVRVEIIDDVPCKDRNGNIVVNHGEALIHTDGTGLISEDLANKCPAGVFKGKVLRTDDLKPLLMQIRLFHDGFAVKGTLLVDKRLPCRTICIRPSMIKVASDRNLLDGQSFNSLEIVTTSTRPKRAFTSRFLITLLHYGGVPVDYFLELLGKAIKDAEKVCHKTSDSLEVAFNHADMDDSMSAWMILSGIQPKDDAYLQSQLDTMTREERKGFKLGRIPIDESYYLMGTADPTGTLKPNEVCVILDNGQLSGEVLVYRHPGLHFGDIHLMTATHIPRLEQDIVGNRKYAIFFPITGPRSLADEMSNGDLDGDMYWVSRNPQLLEHFRTSEPWVQRYPPKRTAQKKPEDFVGSQLESLLFREFYKTRFKPSYAMGTAANCWVVYMDRLLTDEVQENKREWELIKNKMLELVDIYYEALDAPKTGNEVTIPCNLRVKKYPHHMERKAHDEYHSTSVLGKIYDEAISQQSEIFPPIKISPLPCFTEEPVTEECKHLWACRYQEYRREASDIYKVDCDKEEKDRRFVELYQKYKRMLYNAAEFEESPRGRAEVFEEACAIYQLVYEHVMRSNAEARTCGFAWKVGGHALCQLHAIKRGGDTILCSRSVLRDAFVKDRRGT